MPGTPGELTRLYEPAFVPHLLLAGLERSRDKPCVYLGERVLTGREVAEQISRYSQAWGEGRPQAGQQDCDAVAQPA